MQKNCLLFALLAYTLISCKSKNAATGAADHTGAAIPVQTEPVTNVTAGWNLSVSGNIEGNQTVRIGFMVGGKINYIAAQEGQSVSKGQLVASIDPVNYSIAKEMADVQVKQATDEYERLRIMHDRNSLSESDFKKIGFTLEQAKAQQKQQAQNLAYTKLYAPISGVLLRKLAETGEITGVGNPVLVISAISTVKVNAYIPESEIQKIKLGQPAVVQISALDSSFNGRVVEVGSAADPNSRAFTVKIELANPHLYIRPGMIAEVKLPTRQNKSVLAVPAEAVLRDTDDQSYVFIADAGQHKAFKRKVTLGQLADNKVEITSGISAGEIIVTGGQQKLTDGVSITINQ